MTNQVFVNTPATGILTKEGLNLVNRFQDEMLTNPSQAFDNFVGQGYEETKDLCAQFLGANPNQIAFVPNFSYGLSAVIAAIKPKKNKVLVYEDDYPSLLMPFELTGFEIEEMQGEFSNESILQNIESTNCEILALSHVQYLSGYTIDLKLIGDACNAKGITLIIDSTQGMGLAYIDFNNLYIDVLIASNYKWMNAGYGSGTLCLSDGFQKNYLPVIGGRNSMRMINGVFSFPRDINSYEPGHIPLHNLLLLNAALKVKLAVGSAEIEKHSHALINLLIAGVRELPFEVIGRESSENRAGIICLKNQQGLYQHLINAKIVCVERGENVRFGFHYHNSTDDVDAIVTAVESFNQ